MGQFNAKFTCGMPPIIHSLTITIWSRILILGWFLLATCQSLAMADQSSPGDPTRFAHISLGFSSILSGPWAAWGVGVHNGFFLAKEQFGEPLRVDFQDDRGEPKQTLSNVQKFVAERSQVIVIGPMEGLEAAAPIAARKGLPVFALGSITEEILARHPNLIALNAYADADPRYLAAYLQSATTVRTLAILTGTNNVGETMGARMALEAKRRGIEVVRQVSMAVDSSDYRTVVSKLASARPDALFVHQGEQSLLTFIRQAREGGFKGDIYTIFTLETDETRKAMGPHLEGVRYTFPLGTDSGDPKTQKFIKDYQLRYGEIPGGNAAIGFDAFHIIVRSLRSCSSAELECLLAHFREMPDYHGVAGMLTIDSKRGPVRPFGLKEIRNGEFVWLAKDIPL